MEAASSRLLCWVVEAPWGWLGVAGAVIVAEERLVLVLSRFLVYYSSRILRMHLTVISLETIQISGD